MLSLKSFASFHGISAVNLLEAIVISTADVVWVLGNTMANLRLATLIATLAMTYEIVAIAIIPVCVGNSHLLVSTKSEV